MHPISPEKKVAKVNVTIDDDINLILDAVSKVDPVYVMLIIPQGNDLINSPIGLKALRKKTFEIGKRVALVVPKGVAHELATKAGFVSTTTQNAITSDVWQTVETQFEEYKHSQAGMPSKSKSSKDAIADVISNKKQIEYISKKDEPKEPSAPPEIISSSNRVAPPPVDSDKRGKEDKEINPDTKKAIGPNVTGMDFSRMMRQGKAAPLFTKKTKPITVKPEQAEKATERVIGDSRTLDLDTLPKKVGKTVAKLKKKKTKKEAGPFAKIMWVALGGLVVLLVGLFTMYYMYFPGVQITIYPDSYSISVEEEVLASSAITGFDLNRLEIPMKKELIPKTGIRDFNAKEKGVDGTKATGQVQFQNSSDKVVTIPQGTLFVKGDLKFVTVSEVSVPAGVLGSSVGMSTGPVSASEFGDEYNISVGSIVTSSDFESIKGYVNAAFSGGTKREFIVVGQDEVDEAIKKLKEESHKQAVADLELTNLDNGYTFIPESAKTTIKGKAKVEPAVGSEVDESVEMPTVSLETETTGLYYSSSGLNQLAEQLLIEEYLKEKELDPTDVENTVIENLQVVVNDVEVGKDDKVVVKFTATGLATYRLDTEEIKQNIVGKKPQELADYIAQLPGLNKASDVNYSPRWLPEFMRYVPKESGRIDIRIEVVETIVATPSPKVTETEE